MTVQFASKNMKQIGRIAKRYRKLAAEAGVDIEQVELIMDLDACNSNGCPLDFDKLEKFDDFNLAHDMAGIRRHLNRATGVLDGHFLPRCAQQQ